MELPLTLYEGVIHRGAILLADLFEGVGHEKFFVIIGVTADSIAGFFFINSRIHPTIVNHPEQKSMQFMLQKKNYKFLKYDSFLCATKIMKFPMHTLTSAMKECKIKICGTLIEEDLNLVLDACRKSKLFSPKDKKSFFI